MRAVVELNEVDIAQTIANAFDVDATKVVLEYKEVWSGYGTNEHKRYAVSATVTLNGGATDGSD